MKQHMEDDSCDLIMTSPPFALVRKKDYGNESEETYVKWFRDFALQFHRVLKPNGSLVIDIGGSWIPGQPTRSLYHFELVIMRSFARRLGLLAIMREDASPRHDARHHTPF
jgi:site-specific DNA-methyltransferase (cytosine-N4-specific)